MKLVKVFLGGVFLIGIIAAGFTFTSSQRTSVSEEVRKTGVSEGVPSTASVERIATVYKEPNCGCCNGYIAELEKQGFVVEVKSTRDTASVKNQYGIETDKQSCHTTVIGNYFVEGHVPLVAVEKLLSEKPDIDGIGLPGMPIGTPGMLGVQQAPYEVYQKKGTNFTQFMTL